MNTNMVYELCKSRAGFLKCLTENPGIIVIQLTASWCGPCANISKMVAEIFGQISSDKILCVKLDVDQYADMYAFLKSRRMVNGIPTILCYRKKESPTYIPDEVVSGGDKQNVCTFFNQIFRQNGETNV